MYSEQQISDAANADIMELVRSMGMNCEKVGREIHIHGYGGLYVNPEKNVFSCFSRRGTDGKVLGGKGALSFAQKILGYDFKSAMRLISGSEENSFAQYKSGLSVKRERDIEEVPKKREFEMPPRSENSKKLFAYLVKTRGLAPELVSEFMKKGLLYQTSTEINGKRHENGVFLHINQEGKPCGAQMFGISTHGRFKQNVSPDESDRGFVYEKGKNAKTVYLFESAIDLMSFVQLHPGIENAKFVSMSGLKPTIAANYINDTSLKVISCVDSDNAGQAFNRAVFVEKIQNALGLENDPGRRMSGGDPPIEYFSAENNSGKKCCYFTSDDDFRKVLGSDAESLKGCACFVWKNTSSFEICRECAQAGVKDFNDLLRYRTDEAQTFEKCAALTEKFRAESSSIECQISRSNNITTQKGSI